MQDSVFVTLEKPIDYGDSQSTDQIELRCPSFRSVSDRKYYDHLKSMMATIMIDLARDQKDDDENDEDEQDDMNPSLMTYILLSKLGDKYTDEIMAFEKRAHLFCFLDDDNPLKDGPMERISIDDRGLLFGTFMVNFILPSLLKLVNGNDSSPTSSTPTTAD